MDALYAELEQVALWSRDRALGFCAPGDYNSSLEEPEEGCSSQVKANWVRLRNFRLSANLVELEGVMGKPVSFTFSQGRESTSRIDHVFGRYW